MTLTDLAAPTYSQMLGALAAWLRKAQAQVGRDHGDALLSARLADDMFPLATQIRFACVQALEGMHRIRGAEFPPLHAALLDEGRAAGDQPGSLTDALSRIDEALAVVADLAAAGEETDPSAPLAHALPIGMTFDFTGLQYVRDWALPQFYFHVMTAYAILRSREIELGKADYVAHLFPLLRQPDAPPAD
ncbi:hypothetical protein B0I00_1301 [Novosphingobium kunmingense]|uniref:DUF1993 domain-containing protein n=1 Tax=Novosphingobium kunmingense TaxID=1211806 RepID=A0A2N0HJF7_9SPHN|nr:DUF1993 domain-containing protein [Novosphingobium kunmingense]PKB19073.1 hypothetical protein B0I00_1301 [Novosphingobium kunmingense]